jgi:branched-chain amino acid transport system substrate-binding protein
MRQSLYALATAAFLLGACGEQPQTSTPAAPPTTVKASVGSPVTPSGKTRIALLLPLSGSAAPIGQAMQQAAEMALFDTGAKELALAAYDSGDSAETAMEAYRKARTDGVAMVLGPLFGTSAKALAPLVAQGGANVVSFSNDETAAQRGVWIMGIAAPPQVRRVVDYSVESGIRRFAAFAPQTSYGEQMVRALESQATIRGATVAGVELYDPNSADLVTSAKRLAAGLKGDGKLAILVPVAPPRLSTALAALGAAGLDNKSVQFIGTGVWDVPTVGSDAMARGAWYAAPDPARRDDFERRFLATYGRPPNRLATLAYDGVALAGNLARLKPGGDFSAEAITNPNGWSGVDGIFRFLPDGRSERALAVIEVQSSRGAVVSPAPTTFARPTN